VQVLGTPTILKGYPARYKPYKHHGYIVAFRGCDLLGPSLFVTWCRDQDTYRMDIPRFPDCVVLSLETVWGMVYSSYTGAHGNALMAMPSLRLPDVSMMTVKLTAVVLGLMPPQTHRDFSLHFPQPVHSFRSTDPVFLQHSNLHFAFFATIVCYSATAGSSVAEEGTSAMTPHINERKRDYLGLWKDSRKD
jgi:hypothetical protein